MNNGLAKPCFAHRHMTPAEYGLYTHLREVSHPHYTYKFDDRTISDRFALRRGSSKDAVNRLRKSLAKQGFIEWLEPQKRTGGKFAPRLGRIVSHREWAEKHPSRCGNNVLEQNQDQLEILNPPVSNSTSHQSQVTNRQYHFEPHQSQIESAPVSNSTSHQSRQRDIKGITTSGIETNPISRGMVGPDFFENSPPPLSDHANRQSHSESPVTPARQVEVSPVSAARQVTAEERDIASRFNLVERGSEWFTSEGAKLDPKAVDVIFGRDGTK